MECRRRIERDTVIEAKSQADEPSGPAGLNPPRKQAEDMTAPETFAKLQRTLDKGRRQGNSIHDFLIARIAAFGFAAKASRAGRGLSFRLRIMVRAASRM